MRQPCRGWRFDVARAGAAMAGVVLAHVIDYRTLFPNATERAQELEHTGSITPAAPSSEAPAPVEEAAQQE